MTQQADSHFDRATALEPVAEGRFAGVLSEDFWVQSGPNGGYMSAIALRGASSSSRRTNR